MDKALDPVIECPLVYPGEAESAKGYAVRAETAAERAEKVVGGLGSLQGLVDAAAASATAAAGSATAASDSETASKNSADAAAGSKTDAENAAERAAESAAAAKQSAEEANTGKKTVADNVKKVTDSAAAALNSENAAAASAKAADQSAKAAAASKEAAAASAQQAAGSAEAAGSSAEAAAGSAAQASGHAEAAESSANAASDSAEAAAGSAEQASGCAEAAESSANAASDSATAAQSSAEAAQNSAAAAKNSETAAAKSAADAREIKDSMPADYTAMSGDVDTLKNQMQRAYPDDSTIGENPWSSKHIVDMLCPPLQESGNPVVCYPVAGYPLGVKAKWEPMQEGSGTPYPAGGGKNQLNPAEYEAATKTINGITFTRLNTGEVVVNGTATGTAIYVLIENFSYFISISTDRNWGIVGENVISAQGLVSGVTVIRPSDNTSLYIQVQSGTTVKTTVQPQIEKGNTPTAWAPYENIRPIKGLDIVAVERCGENLLDEARFPINKSQNNIVITSQMTLPAGTYTVCVLQVANGVYADGADDYATYESNKHTFTLARQTAVKLRAYWSKGRPENCEKIWLVEGNEWRPYAPYTGQTNTMTLPETVYGGEVDAVTGEGQETWRTINLPKKGWVKDSSTTFTRFNNYTALEAPANSKEQFKNILCNILPSKNTADGDTAIQLENANTTMLRISVSGIKTLEDFLSFLDTYSVQVCYKLAEPVPFTATGGTAFPALAGMNTVLTDADSATVTGRADPIKRITDLEDAVASQT